MSHKERDKREQRAGNETRRPIWVTHIYVIARQACPSSLSEVSTSMTRSHAKTTMYMYCDYSLSLPLVYEQKQCLIKMLYFASCYNVQLIHNGPRVILYTQLVYVHVFCMLLTVFVHYLQ